MDRLDAMAMFVAAVEEGSLAKAARRLARSPASITRGVALVEEHAGGRLLHRSTRSLTLTELGREQIATFRHVLDCLARSRETDGKLIGELSVTAPELFGRLKVLPEVDRFLGAHPGVTARMVFLNRMVDLVEEGIDLAVRIGRLPDSMLTTVELGMLQRLVCASRTYLERFGLPKNPSDLARHSCIDLHVGGSRELWRLRKKPSPVSRLRTVPIGSRLSVNTQAAALDMALLGNGICHSWSYQVAEEIADGRLIRLLKEYEPDPVPVQFVFHATQRSGGTVRSFVEQAAPVLRAGLAKIEKRSGSPTSVQLDDVRAGQERPVGIIAGNDDFVPYPITRRLSGQPVSATNATPTPHCAAAFRRRCDLKNGAPRRINITNIFRHSRYYSPAAGRPPAPFAVEPCPPRYDEDDSLIILSPISVASADDGPA